MTPFTLAVVAASSQGSPAWEEPLRQLIARRWPDGRVRLVVHPQVWARSGHFAGDDETRAQAVIAVANDPDVQAVWFARGGYGANRIAGRVIEALGPAARDKVFMGYSDVGFLLAGLYRARIGRPVHGPMPQDGLRAGGEAALGRALSWLVDQDPTALEPSLVPGQPAVALNLTVLSQLLGTPLQPDLTGHVVMIEDVGEHDYRTDRSLFHLMSQPALGRIAGLRLGRFSAVPENDPPFGETVEQMARRWCHQAGVPLLGPADIGHDADNRVVPFGGV